MIKHPDMSINCVLDIDLREIVTIHQDEYIESNNLKVFRSLIALADMWFGWDSIKFLSPYCHV